MLSLPASVRVYLSTQPADMRKSFDGLCVLVQQVFQRDPLNGHLFLFLNRRRDRLKILYWDRDGLCSGTSVWRRARSSGLCRRAPRPVWNWMRRNWRCCSAAWMSTRLNVASVTPAPGEVAVAARTIVRGSGRRRRSPDFPATFGGGKRDSFFAPCANGRTRSGCVCRSVGRETFWRTFSLLELPPLR